MKQAEHILENDSEVLNFLKSRYPLYHLSNVFFRDIQFGIQAFLEQKGERLRYTEAERLAREFVGTMEKKKIFLPIDQQSWVLNKEDFKTVSVRKTAPAKAAPEKAPAPRPAAGLPPLKGATPAGSPKPAVGLPPLKSAAPAGEKKPAGAGLPPLKSSAKAAGGAPPAPAATAKAAEAAPVTKKTTAEPTAVGETKAESPAKPAPPRLPAAAAKQGGLPPITSSVPAGGKK